MVQLKYLTAFLAILIIALTIVRADDGPPAETNPPAQPAPVSILYC